VLFTAPRLVLRLTANYREPAAGFDFPADVIVPSHFPAMALTFVASFAGGNVAQPSAVTINMAAVVRNTKGPLGEWSKGQGVEALYA